MPKSQPSSAKATAGKEKNKLYYGLLDESGVLEKKTGCLGPD